MQIIKVNGKWELDEMLPRDTSSINKWFELEYVDPKRAKKCVKKVLSWICRKHDTLQNFKKEMEGSDLSKAFIDSAMRTSVNSYDAFIGLFRYE